MDEEEEHDARTTKYAPMCSTKSNPKRTASNHGRNSTNSLLSSRQSHRTRPQKGKHSQSWNQNSRERVDANEKPDEVSYKSGRMRRGVPNEVANSTVPSTHSAPSPNDRPTRTPPPTTASRIQGSTASSHLTRPFSHQAPMIQAPWPPKSHSPNSTFLTL